MRGFARWGLLLLIFAVALVFFGSVLCPPLQERDAEDSGQEVQYPLQEDPGTYRPLPGALQIEDRFPQRDNTGPQRSDSATTEARSYAKIEILALDEQGRPLEDVFVTLKPVMDGSAVVRAKGFTDLDGRYLSPDMFPERVVVELSHPHYFSVMAGPFEMPSTEPVRFERRMQPAGFVEGTVVGTDQEYKTYGWLHLENQEGKGSVVLPVEHGLFRSPPLASGYWRLRWRAHPTAEQDPALIISFPLEPKQGRRFTITVPAGSGASEAAGSGMVGIEELAD